MRKSSYKGIIVVLLVNMCLVAYSQKQYEANWKSIDSRAIPEWYTDAKFGIFIHWGPYSVPAFSKVGQYSEWYWETLTNKSRLKHGHIETKDFHNRVYGEDFTYPDFVPMFKAELFNPEQWASIFEKAGAKYVVLTSKHHDGYCLWPSEESDKNNGRAWSSTNSGPMRDLVGDLTEAVRKTDVKMGLYYSLYEWNNPLYNSDMDLFVDKHMFPQFKDLVNNYKPSLIFTDGEWDYNSDRWRATELLSWLYNNAPNKEEVIINDRWGKETRHIHGGYYTTEYGSGLPNADRVWEENRGMAHSFGFSKTENLEDYNSSQKLIYMLIDIVSRGGNFLLDIGPTADGRIPVIMQERLIDMGDWLKVNGEAIYGTKHRDVTCQWTEGEIREPKRGRYKVKYDVMKLTVDPDPGFAAKEILFTEKDNVLYCICPVFPDEKLVVKNLAVSKDAQVTMLGTNQSLTWEVDGKDIIITMPKVNPSRMPCKYAWTFKIDGI